MIAALLMMLQAPAPPLPSSWKEQPIGINVPPIAWKCTLVDAVGKTFDIGGATPAFAASDTRKSLHSLVVKSLKNPLLAGDQAMSIIYGGEHPTFSMDLAKSPAATKHWMTLFFYPNGSGLATIHTREEANEADGYYATGLCQSDFRWKKS